ncbi:MAG TPA: hypothetical protein VK453_07695 [Micromonosporaceae bacterium]|nr:hypothetical protein [Micromonosporaceae bacterium]
MRLAAEQRGSAARFAEAAREQEEVAKRQEVRAKQMQELADDATEDANRQRANAEEQRRIAISRRVNNQAKAMAPGDPTLALMLGVAAAKVQRDEARTHLAGMLTSTHYAGTVPGAVKVGYVSDDVLLAGCPSGDALKLWNVADRANPNEIADLGVYYRWAINPDRGTVAAYQYGTPFVDLLDVTT